MPRNGAGTYTLPAGNPVVTNTTISSTWANTTLSDIAGGLTQSISKDGQTVPTSNLPMGGFKLTGLSAGTSPGNSIRYEQLFSQGTPSDIASASTVDIGGEYTTFLNVTGNTTITSFGTNYNGPRILKFSSSLTITYNATTLITQTGTNIVTQPGDYATLIPKTTISGTPDGWQVIDYVRADNFPVNNAFTTVASASTVDLTAAQSRFVTISGTTDVTAITTFEADPIYVTASGTFKLVNSSSLIVNNGSDYVCNVGDLFLCYEDGSGNTNIFLIKVNLLLIPEVRQTVLSGPVDSSGFPNFGGSTGSTTVTASGTLTATAADGVYNYTGFILNPSWTGLSVNGTMYLYLNISATGAVSTGSTSLAPVYQFGGSYSTTNGQHTYNIQESVMKVGDGSAANQVYRVFVGEVTVSGGVVTAITWYALKGRYYSPLTTIPSASTRTVFNTNIGVSPQIVRAYVRCKSATGGYAVGEYSNPMSIRDDGTYLYAFPPIVPESANVISYITSNGTNVIQIPSKSSPGSYIQATSANWDLLIQAERGF